MTNAIQHLLTSDAREAAELKRFEAKKKIERRITRKYLTTLVEAGYTLSVDDGGERFAPTAKVNEALENMYAVDDCVVYVRKGEHKSFLRFVFGNEPYEVLNDYGVSLEAIVEPVNQYADKFCK